MASNAAKQPEQPSSGQALAQVDVSKGMVTSEYAGLLGSAGSDFDKQDLSIPFLRILQGLSPYVTKGDPKYNKEADTGMVVETVTPRFFSALESEQGKGLLIIPVMYQRSYTEWAPGRGGLIKDHGSDATIMAQSKTVKGEDGKTRTITPDGNELAEAAQYYVLYAEFPDDPKAPIFLEQAILTMAGTQWKKARDWNTNMSKVRLIAPDGRVVKNPLPFAMSYRFTTVTEQKDENKFFGWKIAPYRFTLELPGGEDLVKYAAEFRHLAASGKVRGVDNTDDDGIPGFDSNDKSAF